MKKLLYMIFVTFFSLCLLTACSEKESELIVSSQPTAEQTTHPTIEHSGNSTENNYYTNNAIDVDCKKTLEVDKNLEKSEIIRNFSLKWKEEMSANYDMLHEKLSSSDKKILESAQIAWEAFVKQELQYKYASSEILNMTEGETDYNNAVSYYEEYRERALELRKYYDLIIEKYGESAYFESAE